MHKAHSIAGIQPSIVRFVRTPDGEGLGVLRTDGSVETWRINANGRGEIQCSSKSSDASIDQLVVLAQGQ